MTEEEKTQYLFDKLMLEVEERTFEDWYQLQFDKTSLKRIRQAAFRNEMERRRARINELFANKNGDKWYRSKVYFISLDEEKGIEKRTACTMMVQANNVKEAWDGLQEGMKGTMADYEVASITETTILDVFAFGVKE